MRKCAFLMSTPGWFCNAAFCLVNGNNFYFPNNDKIIVTNICTMIISSGNSSTFLHMKSSCSRSSSFLPCNTSKTSVAVKISLEENNFQPPFHCENLFELWKQFFPHEFKLSRDDFYPVFNLSNGRVHSTKK